MSRPTGFRAAQTAGCAVCDRFRGAHVPRCKSAVDPCSYRTRTSSPCREAAGLSLRRGDIGTRRGPYGTADCARRSHGSARFVFPNMRRGSSRGRATMARSPRRAVLLLGLLWRCAAAAAAPQECAVCEDTIGHLAASAAARQRSEAGVRAVLEAYCEQERLNTAEAQMCYVLEPMRQQVSAWVALGVDPKRTCAKINRMNGEACALFHESKVGEFDWVQYRPMTAKRRAIVYE